MAQKTTIGWTDATWSPIRARVRSDAWRIAESKGYTSLISIAAKMAGHVGPHCEHASPGCANCYSDSFNSRCLPANGTGLPFDRRSRDLVETFVDEKVLAWPLKWKQPKRIFVENQSDLFGEWVSDEQIDREFAVIAIANHHTYQILTKWPSRMAQYLSGTNGLKTRRRLQDIICPIESIRFGENESIQRERVADRLFDDWPLANVHLGCSVEDQKRADIRIPNLLQCPAAAHFISYEPALELVCFAPKWMTGTSRVDQIIIGAESGRGASPFDEDWARQTRDTCVRYGAAFFYKQKVVNGRKIEAPELDGKTWLEFPRVA